MCAILIFVIKLNRSNNIFYRVCTRIALFIARATITILPNVACPGKDDEVPEYSDGTWFAMLFSCGIGVGLFFFGVAEPIWHYIGPNRYTRDKYMPDNEIAQWAINLTYFHWGVHGWVVYVMVGMIMGFMSFRKGLPMTMKSCFYPLIGDRIYGWIGDFIDTFSVLTTLFGVCTSLGLGTLQVNRG